MPDQNQLGGRPRGAATSTLLAPLLLAALLAGCDAPPHESATPASTRATAPAGPPSAPVPPATPAAAALPKSVPERITITRLGVNAPLVPVGLAPDGTVATPPFSHPRTAGWWTGSVTPGQNGTAVIVGHVDTPTGPAVFYPLTVARPGDTVAISRADHTTADFTVDTIKVIPRNHFDENKIYAPTGHPEIRLITCGGTFDKATQQYSSNVVLYAHLTRSQA